MNKNHENYKNVYSAFRPSDEAIERVMNMTNENQKHFFTFTRRRFVAAAVALALALFVGAGFGLSRIKTKPQSGNDFAILVANAADGEFKRVDEFEEGETLKLNTERTHDIEDFENYVGFEFDDLVFCPGVVDCSDLQSLKVQCSNGNLMLEYYAPQSFQDQTFDVGSSYVSDGPDANEITISGDEIRYSQNSEKIAGEAYEVTGYDIIWTPHYDVVQAYSFGDGYDLTQISDTVTITLTYADGTEKTATMSFQFDSNGYLQFK